jgi:hypothetical protein
MVRSGWVWFALAIAATLGACKRHDAPAPPPLSLNASTTTTTRAGAVPVEPKEARPQPDPTVPPALPGLGAAAGSPRSLAGKKVLHVGDSMVGGSWGLTRAFEAKLATEGARIIRHTKVSESLTSFDKSPTLKDLLRTHDPDIVVITLGANDALVPHPEVFAHSIANVVKRIGDRECWWMGPPMWKEDTGIVAVLRDNTSPCHFFDSSKLELERASDGIHPTDRGGAKWADAFWQAFATP